MKHLTYNLKKQKQIINTTLKVLESGGLVVSPSDTVYGLLVDATNNIAVEKLVQLKNRPAGSPISVFVADFDMLQKLVNVDKYQIKLLHKLLPGPFTIVLTSKHQTVPLLESEKGTLGVRIPDFKLINRLVKVFGKPLTATSANLSGRSPHYSIQSFFRELSEKKKKLIDLIIDAGVLPRNKPSTVIDLTTPQLKMIRGGDIIFSKEKKYISASPSQTKKVAQFILKKLLKKKVRKPLVFILEGELGVGKTVFIKGLGEYLGIRNIVSPSFVIYYEYVSINPSTSLRTGRLIDIFVHVDLYNLQDTEEFKHLGLERYLRSGNLICFEWGEKAGEIIDLIKQKGKIVYIKMKYVNEKERAIQINY